MSVEKVLKDPKKPVTSNAFRVEERIQCEAINPNKKHAITLTNSVLIGKADC